MRSSSERSALSRRHDELGRELHASTIRNRAARNNERRMRERNDMEHSSAHHRGPTFRKRDARPFRCSHASIIADARRLANELHERARAINLLGDRDEIREDLFALHMKDTPPKRVELAIPQRIFAVAPIVRRTINLDGETHFGAREIDNVISDDELPPKRKANLGAGARATGEAPKA